jgi:hypothetical protein
MVISASLHNQYDLIKLRNIETGEEIVLETKMSRYRKICLGFLNTLKQEQKFIKHIILTQREENYKPRILHNFVSYMKRHYKNSLFIWTVESQERGVLHWHMIYAFDWDISFGKEDIQRIQNYWKYGSVEVVPVRKLNFGYLLKYITKALSNSLGENEEFVTDLNKVHRIGSSMIDGYLKQSWKRVIRAIEWFLQFGYADLSEFYWQNGKAYLKTEERKQVQIYKPPKEWECVGRGMSESVFNLF